MPEGPQSTTYYVYISGKLEVGQRKGETVGREKRKSKEKDHSSLLRGKRSMGSRGPCLCPFGLGMPLLLLEH